MIAFKPFPADFCVCWGGLFWWLDFCARETGFYAREKKFCARETILYAREKPFYAQQNNYVFEMVIICLLRETAVYQGFPPPKVKPPNGCISPNPGEMRKSSSP